MSLVLAFILAAALALRLYHLGTPSLWLDEIGQVHVAQRSLAGILDGVRRHHGAAPLDYLVTAVVVRLSSAEGWLRLPAVLWGVLSVYWLFRLGRRFHSSPVGIIAAVLLAGSVLHLRYSQELRFYSLFVLLTLVSSEALMYAWQSRTRKAWLLYAILMVATLYTHYFGLLLLFFHGLWISAQWLVARRNDRSAAKPTAPLLGFFLAALATMASFSPWLLYDAAHERGLPAPLIPELDWSVLTDTLVAFSGMSVMLWPVWITLAGFGLAAIWLRSKPNAVLLASWLLIPLPVIILIDQSLELLLSHPPDALCIASPIFC